MGNYYLFLKETKQKDKTGGESMWIIKSKKE